MSLLRPVAVVLVAVGLVVALGAGTQWLLRVRHVNAEQHRLDRILAERWSPAVDQAGGPLAVRAGPANRLPAAGSAAVRPGTPIARLHLPSLGVSLVIVEGADDAQLARGPGRMAQTAPLGAPGNAGIAGHRYPGVFWDIDRLRPGDPVVVETADHRLMYRTVRTAIVNPEDTTVLAPPTDPGAVLLTLVTCEPKLSTSSRLIKQALLVRTEPRPNLLP